MATGRAASARMATNACTWRSTTASVRPSSRSTSVSPTHTMGISPAASAAMTLCATKASLSWKWCLRSLWPTMAQEHPASRSIRGLISPV